MSACAVPQCGYSVGTSSWKIQDSNCCPVFFFFFSFLTCDVFCVFFVFLFCFFFATCQRRSLVCGEEC